MGALVVAALVAGCAGRSAQDGKDHGYRRVNPGIAFEMLRDSPETLLILDLRSPEQFRGPTGHLRGAYNLPARELAARLDELAGHRGRTFLVYCEDAGCGDESMRLLAANEFGGATLIVGGIEAWIGGGFGTVAVKAPNPPAPEILNPDSADAEAVLPAPSPLPERGTAYLRLADGAFLLPPRQPAALHVIGRLAGGRFFPDGGVRGEGESCQDLTVREPGAAPGWLELSDGMVYADQTARVPMEPYVRGCVGRDGHFRPDRDELDPRSRP
jgi:rhodanese-related sulfurtransferase